MPLVILGLIVILGGCFLIYYQLGPKITLRLKGARGAFSPGQSDAYADADAGSPEDEADSENDGAGEETGPEAEKPQKIKDDKVLYIFGDGEREERSLREDDEHGEDD